MPYQFHVDEGRRIGIVVATAPNDYASSLAGMEEFSKDPLLGPDFGMLTDFRENDYTPSAAEAHELTAAYLRLFRGRPLAIVVTRLVHLGVANMIATIAELKGGSVRVFRDRDEAEAWLVEEVARRREGVS